MNVGWIRFGSLAAVAMWLAFTLAFSVYVNYLSAPEETYGALAGISSAVGEGAMAIRFTRKYLQEI